MGSYEAIVGRRKTHSGVMRVSGLVCGRRRGATGDFIHREIDSKPQSVSGSTASVDTGTSTNRQCIAGVGRVRCNRYSQSLRLDIGRNQWRPQHEGCWGVCTAHVVSCLHRVFQSRPCRTQGWASSTRIPFRHNTKKSPAQGLPINKPLSLRVQVCVTIKDGRAEAFELRASGLG
jgi:hypothetical protein